METKLADTKSREAIVLQKRFFLCEEHEVDAEKRSYYKKVFFNEEHEVDEQQREGKSVTRRFKNLGF